MKYLDNYSDAKKAAKDFAILRFTTAIHYVKLLYTKEEALKIFEEAWERKSKTKFPYD